MAGDKRFAVLIDADNISDQYIKVILDEVSNDGIATYKRIYGNWTSPNLSSWKNVLLDYSITPIQQYSYTTGKNATDSAMIIDAMDILYSEKVEGFCLVSSDSDFTRLAARLRESGMEVIGMGERKTPKPFIAACNRFKYLDVLVGADAAQQQTAAKEAPAPAADKPAPGKKQPPEGNSELAAVCNTVRAIVAENSDEDDWLSMSALGTLLVKRMPDFDVRNFGFSKLTLLVQSLGIFEVRTEKMKDNSSRSYVRIK